MHKSILEAQREFKKAGLNCSVDDQGSKCILKAGISGKSNTYQILYISTDGSNNSIAVRIFRLANFPDNKRMAALDMCNELQLKYRFLRFNVDNDGDMNVEYDFPNATGNIGACCVEILVRIMKIVDDVYPDIMRALWR